MFGFLYEMLGGEHDELARRRRPDPLIAFDGAAGVFVVNEPLSAESGWLGRGQVPGQRPLEAAIATPGTVSLVEEMQQLAAARRRPRLARDESHNGQQTDRDERQADAGADAVVLGSPAPPGGARQRHDEATADEHPERRAH